MGYTSSNPSLTITDNYSQTKKVAGVETEEIMYQGIKTNEVLSRIGEPSLDAATGIATFTNGYYGLKSSKESFYVMLLTDNDITTDQTVLQIGRETTVGVLKIVGGKLKLNFYNNGILTEQTELADISANTAYSIEIRYSRPFRYDILITNLYTSTEVTTYFMSNDKLRLSVLGSGLVDTTNNFKGGIFLSDSFIFQGEMVGYHLQKMNKYICQTLIMQ